MFKSTAGALVLLLVAVSAAPQPDGDPPSPSSVIKQAFYIFPPPPKGGGAVAGGRGRFGCDNPHPYCMKDNHPKEACTDWGEGWKGWMEENCPEKCGKCGGGGGGPPPPPGPSAPGKGAPPPGPGPGPKPPGPKPPGPKPPGPKPPGPVPDASCGNLKNTEGYPCAKYVHFCGIDSSNGKQIGQLCPKTCCENKEDLPSGCNKPADKEPWCKNYRGKVHCKDNEYTKENCPTSCG